MNTFRTWPLKVVVSGLFLLPAFGASAQAPLVARWTMTPDPADKTRLADSGPLHLDGRLHGDMAWVAGGHDGTGSGLAFSGAGDERPASIESPGLLNQMGGPLTVSLWIKPAAFGKAGSPAILLTKTSQGWIGHPFSLRLGDDGAVGFDSSDTPAGGWSSTHLKTGEWAYVAVTVRPDGKRVLYVNGADVGEGPAGNDLYSNDEPLVFGNENGWNGPGGARTKYQGLMQEVHVYAAALTPDQITADMAGTLATRAAQASDIAPPTYAATLHLVRWDMPLGLRDYRGITRQDVVRRPGPDAVDWPTVTLTSPLAGPRSLFGNGPVADVVLPERHLPESMALFQKPDDPVISPGGHWLRAGKLALWGRRDVFTTDMSVRSGGSQYELWTFPVKITGPLTQVALSVDGRPLYHRAEALHSLTLLLPQNAPGHPYRLSVNGRAPVVFSVGLAAIRPGDPVNAPLTVHQRVPGTSVTVATLRRPETFPNRAEWDADQKALGPAEGALPPPFLVAEKVRSFTQHVGVDVPRSPEMVYATSLHAGMSGGFKYWSEQGPGFQGTPEDYARFLAGLGYDATFEDSRNGVLGSPQDPNSYEHWMAAMEAHGLKAGINAISLGDPDQAFYGANLPDWHRPKYRDAQLLAQRFARFPNFLGMTMGADNADYSWYWDWNGPTSEHPWGPAFQVMQAAAGKPPRAPLPPNFPAGKPHEYASTMRDFLDYVHRYNQAFVHYGDLAAAVQEISPVLMMTSGSFGTAAGVGARGGYNWGTVPGREMFARLPVLQTYDWNEQKSSKPGQNPAMMDRLKSYYPDKPGFALLDDFQLFFGAGPMQRAYAFALTRGVQAIGTSFLANADNVKTYNADPGLMDAQRAMSQWAHRYGGAYAMTRPAPSIGILYVNDQALARPVVGGDNPPDDQLLHGSHEGKTFEAFFLCHAAGWPAKIITPEEMRRGLPPSMKAILLVGLNRVDDTWRWYDGLTPLLEAFVAKGGRILTDDESLSPVPATSTDMHVRAYVINRDMDWTPELLARNEDNIHRLQVAMRGVAPPVAETGRDTVWAIPTVAGDVQYVTVLNQATPPGQNASRVVQPQTGHLTWHTARPIYDVRLGRRLTAEEATAVDLTHDPFQFYALPPAAVAAPHVTVTPGPDGFYRAAVTVGATSIRGVPIQLTVRHGGEAAAVYAATGLMTKLPLASGDAPGTYAVEAKELLSGLTGDALVRVLGVGGVAGGGSQTTAQLARFADRRAVPLTVALTPTQADSSQTRALARQLIAYYRGKGRTVRLGRISPDDVVVSLQPLTGVQPYPRWQTVPTDFVLLGSPEDNVLLLDQTRGFLLPDTGGPGAGQGLAKVTYSPFVGGCEVLNLLAGDAAGLGAAARRAMR